MTAGAGNSATEQRGSLFRETVSAPAAALAAIQESDVASHTDTEVETDGDATDARGAGTHTGYDSDTESSSSDSEADSDDDDSDDDADGSNGDGSGGACKGTGGRSRRSDAAAAAARVMMHGRALARAERDVRSEAESDDADASDSESGCESGSGCESERERVPCYAMESSTTSKSDRSDTVAESDDGQGGSGSSGDGLTATEAAPTTSPARVHGTTAKCGPRVSSSAAPQLGKLSRRRSKSLGAPGATASFIKHMATKDAVLAMQTHPRLLEVQREGCRRLAELVQEERQEHRQKQQKELHTALSDCACGAGMNLADPADGSGQHHQQQHDVPAHAQGFGLSDVDAQRIDVTIAALQRFPEDLELQTNGLAVLASLAVRGNAGDAIASKHGIDVLLDALLAFGAKEHGLVSEAVALLDQLTINSHELRRQVAMKGGVQALSHVLCSCLRCSPKSVRHMLCCLYHLSFDPAARARMIHMGIPALVGRKLACPLLDVASHPELRLLATDLSHRLSID